MPNLLVIDIAQESGVLLKCMLKNYYGVSISDTCEDALSKIETALFDAVVVDTPKMNAEVNKLVANIKKLIPQLPIIGVMNDETVPDGFAKVVNHPLNAIQFLKTVRNGLRSAVAGKPAHREITYNTEISADKAGSDSIKCRLVNLSLNGMLLENFMPVIGGDSIKEKEKFSTFFTRFSPGKQNRLIASLLFKQQDTPLRLKSHIAFMDKEPSEQIRDVGLYFDDLKQDDQQALESLIAAAPAA